MSTTETKTDIGANASAKPRRKFKRRPIPKLEQSMVHVAVKTWSESNSPLKVKWLLLCHGQKDRNITSYLPSELQKDAIGFSIDSRPNRNPHLLMDITHDLHLLPDNSFDGVMWAFGPQILIADPDILTQLRRIVKPKGFWILARTCKRALKPKGTLRELILNERDRRSAPSDHFTVPQIVQHIPDVHRTAFDQFLQEEANTLALRRAFRDPQAPKSRKIIADFLQQRQEEAFAKAFGVKYSDYIKSLGQRPEGVAAPSLKKGPERMIVNELPLPS